MRGGCPSAQVCGTLSNRACAAAFAPSACAHVAKRRQRHTLKSQGSGRTSAVAQSRQPRIRTA
eukprot:1313693-Pleurochrysis_carterae.AAC.1